MFELHITDTDATSGTVPVSWCFDRPTFEKLKKEHGLENLQVVIVVSPVSDPYNDRQETRYIVPISQMMTYISFRFPGPNKIWATIAKGSTRTIRKIVHQRAWDFSRGKYDLKVINEEGTDYADGAVRLGIPPEEAITATPLSVEVPEECFAKEPPAWEKAWNTWMISDDRFEDQCAYRRRRIFSYTIQPIPFLLFYLGKVLGVLMAAYMGARGLSLRPLTQPLSPFGQIVDQLEPGLIFVRKEPAPYRFWPMLFWPPLVTFVTAVTLLGWWVKVGLIFGIALGLILIGVLFFNASGIWSRFCDWLEDLLTPADVDLVCTDGPQKPRKTLLLRYQALKSKVCKPFPG